MKYGFDVKEGEWNGFPMIEFEFEGRQAILVMPKTANERRDWSIRTEYWGVFNETEVELLKRGYHAAYLKNEGRMATKSDCDAKARFADFLAEEFGLAKKCVPIGFSLGGAHAVNFAGYYPEKVGCLFLDAPVLSFLSYPGRPEHRAVWDKEFTVAYPGIKHYHLYTFDNHPMGKIDTLLAHRIPVFMSYGTEDATVMYYENGALLAEAYESAPELIRVVPRNFQGHHPHGLGWRAHETADFITEHNI